MSEQTRSTNSATSFIVGFILLALAGIAGNYALDMYRRDGRTAATHINNDLRNTEESLADLGAAEASYIAAGQNAEASTAWMNTATSLSEQLETSLAALSAATASPLARGHYTTAAPLVTVITANDRKARGLVGTAQFLVAADVVLIEGAEPVKQLKAELAGARDAEMAGFETKAEKLGWIGLGGNAGIMLIGLLLLVGAARGSSVETSDASAGLGLNSQSAAPAHEAPAAPAAPAAQEHPTSGAWSAASPDLSGAADLCVDLGSVQEHGQLTPLMARAATVLDAKGLVLWVSEAGGGVLRPTIAHGYSDRVLQRMGTLPADGDNVTSLAFRTKQPQVVRGSIDGHGAIAVPLIAGSGCVGVLAAEVQGAKPGDARFAIARMIAAQLSTLVGPGTSVETPKSPSQM